MSRSPLQPQPDDHRPQPQPQPHEPQSQSQPHKPPSQFQSQPQAQPHEPQSQPQPSASASNALPITILVLRVITVICLIVSLIILASDTASVQGQYRKVTFRFKHIYAYRYMLSTIVLGLVYTLLQLPFAIHHVSLGKRLMNHDGLRQFDLIGDKVLLSLLATGVGAAFGATLDLKKNLDGLEVIVEDYCVIPNFDILRSKLDNFFNVAYVSAGFLLIAFLSTIASSTLSSLALANK